MKKLTFFLALILCASMAFSVGCDSGGGSDSGDGNNGGGNNGGDVSEYTNVNTDLDFDSWGGGTYLAKGTAVAGSNNDTTVTIDGHDALCLHAEAADNDGYGYAIEGQWDLSGAPVDMSGENYAISFDIYVPQVTYNQAAEVAVQFAFYETSDYTPIYSVWYVSSVVADTWVTLTAPIDTESGMIDYSGFTNNPGDWTAMSAVRIQCILNGDGAAVGDEILLYIDNLQVLYK